MNAFRESAWWSLKHHDGEYGMDGCYGIDTPEGVGNIPPPESEIEHSPKGTETEFARNGITHGR